MIERIKKASGEYCDNPCDSTLERLLACSIEYAQAKKKAADSRDAWKMKRRGNG